MEYILSNSYVLALTSTMAFEKLTNLVYSSDDDSDMSDDEYFCQYDVVDSLKYSYMPRLTPDEFKFKNTYTYDKEPVKEWRQVSDYDAIKECNEVKWSEISKLVGEFHGYHNSLSLYRNSNSTLVNLIEKIICENKCYYFPGKCFLKHGFNFKKLLKKNLHDKLYPEFGNLFKEKSKTVELQLQENGVPKLLELAKDIGFNTVLDYDDEGYLKLDFSVFKEEYWKHERPCFVWEEKKVLDIIHALLISSSKKQMDEVSLATRIYSQSMPGLNEPILKIMCHGPDLELKRNCYNNEVDCDITKDEENVKFTGFTSVKHDNCTSFKREDHWKYVHGITGTDVSECETNADKILEGPVSDLKSLGISYPCNLRHCWLSCRCTFCQMARLMKCRNHKEHMTYNIKDCIIQQSAQCQEHWVDHPENFNSDDIEIEKKILFHNKKLKKDGRNYHTESIKYAGLKKECSKCRKNTKEHLNKHLTPHLQCKHCLYEMKTMEDKSFWRRVCTVCGKLFSSEHSKVRHSKQHDNPKQECEECKEKFSTKYNMHRHILEKHNLIHENSMVCEESEVLTENTFACQVCNKSFKYLRNMKAHVYAVHDKQDECECAICGQKINRSSDFKRHLVEQHKVIDSDKVVNLKTIDSFKCNVCEKVFLRKGYLETHLKSHSPEGYQYKCDQCSKTFSTKSTLARHQQGVHGDTIYNCDLCGKRYSRKGYLETLLKRHSSEGYQYKCNECGKQYSTLFNLNRHQNIHEDNKKNFPCDQCTKTFLTKSTLARHQQGVHDDIIYNCDLCGKRYSRLDTLNYHIKKSHV